MSVGHARTICFALGLAALLPQPAAAFETPPERVTNITVYGEENCPKPKGDEIVVCARKPEGERYRIPKELREEKSNRGPSAAWGSRVEGLEDASRAERPNSCSTVGSGGQSGCTQQLLQQWRAERRARRR